MLCGMIGDRICLRYLNMFYASNIITALVLSLFENKTRFKISCKWPLQNVFLHKNAFVFYVKFIYYVIHCY